MVSVWPKVELIVPWGIAEEETPAARQEREPGSFAWDEINGLESWTHGVWILVSWAVFMCPVCVSAQHFLQHETLEIYRGEDCSREAKENLQMHALCRRVFISWQWMVGYTSASSCLYILRPLTVKLQFVLTQTTDWKSAREYDIFTCLYFPQLKENFFPAWEEWIFIYFCLFLCHGWEPTQNSLHK